LPSVYEFRIRSRIFRWYARLRSVEEAIGTRPADELQRELEPGSVSPRGKVAHPEGAVDAGGFCVNV
jgi:hypothetical protein